jgi:hypothetical protein
MALRSGPPARTSSMYVGYLRKNLGDDAIETAREAHLDRPGSPPREAHEETRTGMGALVSRAAVLPRIALLAPRPRRPTTRR